MTAPTRNRFHSICPYFAMFPESFVEEWLCRLTTPGQIVLDPFCGRGTTPFQALLMGRRAIGCDVNPVAYCISRAKTQLVSPAAIRRRVTVLESGYDSKSWNKARRSMSPFFARAYDAETMRQLLYLRQKLNWRSTKLDCMITAILLGALHGESNKSPSYLSNQMPRTISTKPEYSIRFWDRRGFTPPKRDVFELLRRLVDFRFVSDLPMRSAEIVNEDMRSLPATLGTKRKIRCVITSPPYFDTTNFEEDQWLRLWFLGGPERPTQNRHSRDDRHGDAAKYWNFIADMWRSLGQVLAKEADVVVRIGTSRGEAEDLPRKLAECAKFTSRSVELVEQQISPIRRRQTDSFRPGSAGCRFEVDCHFRVA